MKVSVIIPTYNRCQMLKQCLDSLARQTYPHSDFEVIVVDDGSPDKTSEAIDSFREKINIYYVRQEHKGPGAARNSGLKQAKADIIAFIDDDCFAQDDWLERISDFYTNNPQTKVLQGKYFTSADRKNIFGLAIENLFEAYSQYEGQSKDAKNKGVSLFDSANFSARKEVFQDLGDFDPLLARAEDMDFRCRLQSSGYKIFYGPKIIVKEHPRKNIFVFILQSFREGFWSYRVRKRWKQRVTFTKEKAFSGKKMRLLLYTRVIAGRLFKEFGVKGIVMFLIIVLRKTMVSFGYFSALSRAGIDKISIFRSNNTDQCFK